MPWRPSSTDKLGLHFMDEMYAAGIVDPPITIHYDTGVIDGRENLSAADNAKLDAVLAAHVPTAWLDQQNAAKAQREANAADSGTLDLEAKLRTMTPVEIDAWIKGLNDPNLRIVVANALKLLAARLGEPGRIVPMT